MPRTLDWPPLPLAPWKETCDALHLYAQVVGKVRLGLTPKTNQWWNVALQLTARGLTTGAMPYAGDTVELRFDLLDHALLFETAGGERRVLPLGPGTVADFTQHVLAVLDSLGVGVRFWAMPVEIAGAVPFLDDRRARPYDGAAVTRYFRVLQQVAAILERFRAEFRGKCSPVQFYWGTFDLAVSRHSGRMAPPRADADTITRDAYDEEVSEVGFWPGDDVLADAAFFAFTAPEPRGFDRAAVRPRAAYYSPQHHLFLLRYEEARTAPDPEAAILDFARTTYEAGAALAGWPRDALAYAGAPAERHHGV